MSQSPISLSPFRGKSTINVIVETPAGSRNKFTYDPELGLFTLKKVLPAGYCFPFDFGFVPGTLAPDGDPADVLLLLDEAAFPGCLVIGRLIGVFEASETKQGVTRRNDRFVAVASESHQFANVSALTDLPSDITAQLEHFFSSYNAFSGKVLKVTARRGPRPARRLLESLANAKTQAAAKGVP